MGREHISLSGIIPSLSSTTEVNDLDNLKATLSAKVTNSSYESQMMDHLHSTAYQTSPQGNSLGNALEGSVESIASITKEDVASVLGNVSGGDVVVVGTGGGGGSGHEKLVEDVEKAYGGLAKGVGSGSSEVASLGEKSAFIGSDVR